MSFVLCLMSFTRSFLSLMSQSNAIGLYMAEPFRLVAHCPKLTSHNSKPTTHRSKPVVRSLKKKNRRRRCKPYDLTTPKYTPKGGIQG